MKKSIKKIVFKKLLAITLMMLPLKGITQNNSLVFDGLDDYAFIPHHPVLNFGTGDFTIEMKIKSDVRNSMNDTKLLSKNDNTDTGFEFGIKTDGHLFFRMGGQEFREITNGRSLFDESCHHVALTRSGQLLTFFIDGFPNRFNVPITNIHSGNDLIIGRNLSNHYEKSYRGAVSDLRVWRTARTEEEIKINMEELNGSRNGLVGHWKMMEVPNKIVYDFSLVKNHGETGPIPKQPIFNKFNCCYVKASFSIPKDRIYEDELVVFTNTSINYENITWKIDGVLQITSAKLGLNDNLITVFQNPGTYNVELTATNKGCKSIFNKQILVLQLLPVDISNSPTLMDSLSLAFDRFGNTYSGIALEPVKHSHGGAHRVAGIFEFDFTGNEFVNNANSPDVIGMVNVITQVFTDLSGLISNSQCQGNNPRVKIEVNSDGLASTELARASSYYATCGGLDNTGLIDGDVWKVINTGTSLPAGYEGYLKINFDLSGFGAGIAWNFNTAVIPAVNELDAYSVVLHEAMHILGIASFIGVNGNSVAPNIVSTHYTRYDAHLTASGTPLTASGTPLINWDGCYAANFSGSAGSLTSGCNTIAFSGNNAGVQPVYAPGTFQPGVSLSHLDITCSGINYLMHPFIGLGQAKRTPTVEELRILCDIGYQINGVCGSIVAGLDDGVAQSCNTNDITVDACDFITVEPLLNDINAATFECLRIVNGLGVVTGNINAASGTLFDYDPQGNIGVTTITYIPVDANGNKGNITCVRIFVKPCGGKACNTLNICNQICNSSFLTKDPALFSHGDPHYNSQGLTTVTFDDLGSYGMWASGIHFGNNVQIGEGMLFYIDVQPNTNYIFSYYRSQGNTTVLDNVFVYLIRSDNNTGIPKPPPPKGDYSIPNIPPINFLILNEQNLTITNEFEQVTVCFTSDANSYDWLWIFPKQDLGNLQSSITIDRVNLIQDNFTAGTDQNITTCGEVFIGEDICEIDEMSHTWSVSAGDFNSILEVVNQNQLRVKPTINTTYTLSRTFPTNPTSSTIVAPNSITCLLQDDVDLIINNPLSASLLTTDVTCDVASNGSITANPTGGTPPYSYLWSNGQLTQTVSTLTAGSYSVVVKDANNCSYSASAVINVSPNPPFSVVLDAMDESCNGSADGSITATPSGGVEPYTYIWSNGQTTQKIDNLIAGTYTVIVVDNNGCSLNFDKIITFKNTAFQVTFELKGVSCDGASDGTITPVFSDGTGPYLFIWSNAPSNNGNTAKNLSAGVSYEGIAEDQSGCILNYTAPQLTIDRFQAGVSTKPITCNGTDDASATVFSINNGSPPFIGIWRTLSPIRVFTSASNIPAGNHSVEVIDNNGCLDTVEFVIDPKPSVPLSVTVSGTSDESCSHFGDGIIQIAIAGGVLPYSILWSDGKTYKTGGTGVAGSSAHAINRIGTTGTYSVEVTDYSGCKASATATLNDPGIDCPCDGSTNPSIPLLSITVSSTKDESCTDMEDGLIQILITGGVLPYSILWSDGKEYKTGGTGIAVSSTTINRFGSIGTYTVDVTDFTGCKASATATLYDPGINCLCDGFTKIFGNNNDTLTPCGKKYLVTPCPPYDFVVHFGFTNTSSFTWIGPMEITLILDPTMDYKSTLKGSSPNIVSSQVLKYTYSNDVPGFQIIPEFVTEISMNSMTKPIDGWYITVLFETTCSDGSTINLNKELIMNEACSCDPNDKLVTPKGCGELGLMTFRDIDYLIRFQNIGTGFAKDVVVRDTLDIDFDINSLRLIEASHPISNFLVDADSREITTSFFDINLAPVSLDHNASVGFIMLNVTPGVNFIDGTTLSNTTSIYFDTNPPVRTNVTINTLVEDTLAKVQITKNTDIIYFGYEPLECATLTAEHISGGLAPFSYLWSTGDTTQSITVCPDTATNYSVTIFSAGGCEGTSSSTIINVIDVRCGSNLDKVLVCHVPDGNIANAHEICVSENSANTYLADGDFLGNCNNISGKSSVTNGIYNSPSNNATIFLDAYPNPFTESTTIAFSLPVSGKVALSVFNLSGEIIAELFNDFAKEGNLYTFEFNPVNISNGVYFYQLVNSSNMLTRKLVVVK